MQRGLALCTTGGMKNCIPLAAALCACLALSCMRDPAQETSRAGSAAPGSASIIKEMAVTERGYSPARLEVEGGKPFILRVTRKTADTCGAALLVDGDPVEHLLPEGRAVDVRVTPPKSGELAFTCGMHMMHGVLVAR